MAASNPGSGKAKRGYTNKDIAKAAVKKAGGSGAVKGKKADQIAKAAINNSATKKRNDATKVKTRQTVERAIADKAVRKATGKSWVKAPTGQSSAIAKAAIKKAANAKNKSVSSTKTSQVKTSIKTKNQAVNIAKGVGRKGATQQQIAYKANTNKLKEKLDR